MTDILLADVSGEIKERFQKWNELFASQDVDALVDEMYTDDCNICIQGHPVIKGKQGQLNVCVRSLYDQRQTGSDNCVSGHHMIKGKQGQLIVYVRSLYDEQQTGSAKCVSAII